VKLIVVRFERSQKKFKFDVKVKATKPCEDNAIRVLKKCKLSRRLFEKLKYVLQTILSIRVKRGCGEGFRFFSE